MYGTLFSECMYDVLPQPHEGRLGKLRILKNAYGKNRTFAYAGLKVDEYSKTEYSLSEGWLPSY
jgi:hypothetical protein